VLNGACLALSNPVQMGTVLADDAGTATLTLLIPASAPVGATPRFQAVGLRPTGQANVSPPVDSFLIAEATCTNGLWESPEQCDDANDVARDGCTSACTLDVDFRGAHAALLTLEAGAVVPIFGPVTGTCTTEGPLFVTADPLTSALIVEYSDECIMAGFLGTFGAGGITVQGTVVGNTIVGEATLMVAGLPLNSAPISWPLAAPGVLEVQAPFNTTVQGIAFVGAVELWSDLSQ
jgi:cysteine-rich repeat protein